MKRLGMIHGLLMVAILSMASICWGTNVTYSGQATAAKVTVLGLATTISDTGLVPTAGGARENDLITVGIPGVLSGAVAHATAISIGDHTEASASLAGLNLLDGGIAITADLIQSRAYAAVSKGKVSAIMGSSQIANLVINGQPIVVSGSPNQTIPLLLGQVVINEQTQSAGMINVVALHVTLLGGIDIQLGRSYAVVGPCTGCSNTCSGTPNCSSNSDFLTGSGSLLNSANKLVNFALSTGLLNGSNWGDFVFEDASSLINLQSKSILQYSVISAAERQVSGVALLNGVANVNYLLDVVQNSAGGSTFTLTLSNGYKITGTVNLGFVQIRQACG